MFNLIVKDKKSESPESGYKKLLPVEDLTLRLNRVIMTAGSYIINKGFDRHTNILLEDMISICEQIVNAAKTRRVPANLWMLLLEIDSDYGSWSHDKFWSLMPSEGGSGILHADISYTIFARYEYFKNYSEFEKKYELFFQIKSVKGTK